MEAFQQPLDMRHVLFEGSFRVDEAIVEENGDQFSNEFAQALVDVALENGGSVGESNPSEGAE